MFLDNIEKISEAIEENCGESKGPCPCCCTVSIVYSAVQQVDGSTIRIIHSVFAKKENIKCEKINDPGAIILPIHQYYFDKFTIFDESNIKVPTLTNTKYALNNDQYDREITINFNFESITHYNYFNMLIYLL